MATKPGQQETKIEQRLRALERSVEELRKMIGDLKFEVEQMREE